MELTIKLNKSDINDVIRDLERYDYNVKASFKENDPTPIF